MFREERTIIIAEAGMDELWETHSDVKNWPKWQENIEWTKVEGKIEKGTKFTIKPKGSAKVNLEVLVFDKPSQFTDVSYLPLCKMFTTTKMREVQNGVEVKLIVEMKGLLTFLWKNIVAKGVLNGHLHQYESMVKYIRSTTV